MHNEPNGEGSEQVISLISPSLSWVRFVFVSSCFFNEQIQHIKKEARRKVNSNIQLDRKSLETIYVFCARPILEYNMPFGRAAYFTIDLVSPLWIPNNSIDFTSSDTVPCIQ